MACSYEVGSVFYREVALVNPSGPSIGLPVNADSLPTVDMLVNGVAVTNPSDLVVVHLATGRYSVAFTVGVWTIGQNVSVFMTAVMAAFAGSPFRMQIDSFSVSPPPIGAVIGIPAVSRAGIELIYGASNVARWADANNDGNSTDISNRIIWAANRARMYVEGRLAKRFITPFDPYPELVVELICERAGIELYRSPRGLVEGSDEFAAILQHKDEVEARIQQILAGTLFLGDAVNTCTSTPQAICNDPNPLNDLNDLGVFAPVDQFPFLFPSEAYYFQTAFTDFVFP